MRPQPVDSQVIARVAEDYRRRGYDVEIVHDNRALPEFLGGFLPDLIARSPSDSVVVEVKVGTRTSVAEHFKEVAERVNRQPGWRFSLVFVNPDRPDEITEAQPAPLSMLQERADNAQSLIETGQTEAAFLLLFSALEGTLRILARRAQLPLENLPPSALIRELYSAGEIGRDQFELLLRLLPVRNQMVHGFRPSQSLDVEELRALLQTLLSEAAPGESSQPA